MLMLRGLQESRKRLWILFRMVHLSSVLPPEVQGQLGPLVQQYMRPVLLERRMPIQCDQILPFQDECNQQDVHDGASETAAGQQHDSVVDEEDVMSWCNTTTYSSLSVDQHRPDSTKALRKLFATQGDLVRVLSRLPQAALTREYTENALVSSILDDIFSSIIVMLSSLGPNSVKSSMTGVVGSVTGYSYGDTLYEFKRAQTCILIRVILPSSSAIDLGVTNATSTVEQVSVPLTSVMDEEPNLMLAAAIWKELSRATSFQFGEAGLKKRRHTLRRAKGNLRSLSQRTSISG